MTVHLTGTPVLETERLILRAPEGRDYDAFWAFAQTDRAKFIGGPFKEQAAWRGFGHLIGHWAMRGYGMFIVTLRGQDVALGAVGPWYPATWNDHEIGWSLWSTGAEGTGIAHEAALATRAYAYGTLGWTTAVSNIDVDNMRSRALAERLGAVIDPNAAKMPLPDDDETEVLVYRHPSPEALS